MDYGAPVGREPRLPSVSPSYLEEVAKLAGEAVARGDAFAEGPEYWGLTRQAAHRRKRTGG